MKRRVLCAIAFLLMSCQKNQPGPPEEGGGMDGGGGTFIFNSRADVITISNAVWASFALKRADNPLVIALERARKMDTNEARHVHAMLAKIMDEPDDRDPFKFADYLQGRKPNFNETEYCRSINHVHAAASVSRLDRAGEICVSVPALMRIATSGLQGDLLALFAHELGHLNGYGEEDCHRLQRWFLENMAALLRRSGEGTLRQFVAGLRAAIRRWPELVTFKTMTENQMSWQIHRVIDPIEVAFRALPEPFHNDYVSVAHPDDYPRLSNSLAQQSVVTPFILFSLAKGSPEDVLKRLRELVLTVLADEVRALWYVYGDKADLSENASDQKLITAVTEPEVLKTTLPECWKSGLVDEDRAREALEECLLKAKPPPSTQ